MDSNGRNCKGLAKGKLVIMSLYRATSKPPSTVQQHNASTSKVKPSPLIPFSVGFTVDQDHQITPPKQRVLPPSSGSAKYIVNHDQVTPQPTILLQESSRCDVYAAVVDNVYGFAADESVDTKAASYISSVRERFGLRRVNSEHKKFQDGPH